MKNWIATLMIATAMSTSAFAGDCGEPPVDKPAVPDGASATQATIREARDAVIAYSGKVDKYLQCMDTRAASVIPYLTKEQKVRWDEDLASLHEQRRDLQTKMNEAIRAYRNAIRQK